jgi:putative membrane protein
VIGYDWDTFITLTYLWFKSAHVIFVIFWIARERKLRMIIINPSMILVWLFGLWLAFNGGWWQSGWMQAKFAIVFALSGYHGWMVSYGKRLARGERPVSGKALRMMNEIPGIATAIIVILVIVKPF